MNSLDSELCRRLQTLEEQDLRRLLRRVSSPQQPRAIVNGRELLNFSSNDYLGLATHPALKAAAHEAVDRWGAGSGASRLISGSLEPHHELEEALASFKNTEAALVFSTGYATALGTITALVGKTDILVLDKLVHASIVDAARLSGATLRIFRHNDVDDLDRILQWADRQRTQRPETRILVVTESLFSMDGDFANLTEIVALKEKYGAWLMLDEAHATGLFGPNRRGLAEDQGVSDRVEVQMGTLGKALGSAGGYIAGSRTLIDYLVNKARSFIFSTAPPPSASAAARAALTVLQSEEGSGLLGNLRANITAFLNPGIPAAAPNSPIIPLVIGSEAATVETANRLREEGIFVPAIRYPTVARGKGRLRFTLSATHSVDEINFVRDVLSRFIKSI